MVKPTAPNRATGTAVIKLKESEKPIVCGDFQQSEKRCRSADFMAFSVLCDTGILQASR